MDKTPEEVESEAVKKDWEQAEKEEKAAVEAVEALPTQYHDVREYWGIGPLAYETKRGFVKVNSGDVIIQFEFPIEGTDPPEFEQETVVMSKKAQEAIAGAIPTDPPVGLAVRAQRITDKRRNPKLSEPKPMQPIAPKPKAAQLPAK